MDNLDTNRNESYKKDSTCEDLLEKMNKALVPTEKELLKDFDSPDLPVIFIVGAQRSGTTFLMQLMTQYFELSYPNNFIARYWDIPFIGAMLYKNLAEEIIVDKYNLSSDLGYTKGLEGPHEFGYFWKKWFPWESWEENNDTQKDYRVFKKQLAAWESVNSTPIIFKNLLQVDFNIFKIKEIIPNAFFIFLERDIVYNVQSTYRSRIKLFGDKRKWFGVKPPRFHEYQKLPVMEQITRQIIDTNRAIREQLDQLPATDSVTMQYENLISNTQPELDRVGRKLDLRNRDTIDFFQSEFISGNSIKIDTEIFKNIEEVCRELSN